MRHQPFSYSGFHGAAHGPGTTYGEVEVPPEPAPAPPVAKPRAPSRSPQQRVDFIVEGFEKVGKREGLRRAATISGRPEVGNEYIDGAAKYLSSRKLDAQGIQKEIAQLKAQRARLQNLYRFRPGAPPSGPAPRRAALGRFHSLSVEIMFLEKRLASIASQPQAVADLPDLPVKEGSRPGWVPYLSLGLAIAGFMMAVGSKRRK